MQLPVATLTLGNMGRVIGATVLLQRRSWHLHRRSTLRDSLWTNAEGLGFPDTGFLEAAAQDSFQLS